MSRELIKRVPKIASSDCSKTRLKSRSLSTFGFSLRAGMHTSPSSFHCSWRECCISTASTILDIWPSSQFTLPMRASTVGRAKSSYSSVPFSSLVNTSIVYTTKFTWSKIIRNRLKISSGGICSHIVTKFQAITWKTLSTLLKASTCISDWHRILRNGAIYSWWKYW